MSQFFSSDFLFYLFFYFFILLKPLTLIALLADYKFFHTYFEVNLFVCFLDTDDFISLTERSSLRRRRKILFKSQGAVTLIPYSGMWTVGLDHKVLDT